MQSNLQSKSAHLSHGLQQRQILKLMGIKVWVTHQSPTLSFDSDMLNSIALEAEEAIKVNDAHASVNTNKTTATIPAVISTPQNHPNINDADIIQDSASHTRFNDESLGNPDSIGQVHESLYNVNQASSTEYITDKHADSQYQDNQQDILNNKGSEYKTIPAFNLVGAKYKAWVLMVDAKVFDTPQLAKLWDNIVRSLSLTVHNISFPFFNQMQDESVANACLSGFIYRIAKREDIQVAMLTALPDGLYDERIIAAPQLSDMIKDGQFKKQLWELIR